MLQINCIYIDFYLVQITYAEQTCPSFSPISETGVEIEIIFVSDFIAEDPSSVSMRLECLQNMEKYAFHSNFTIKITIFDLIVLGTGTKLYLLAKYLFGPSL